MCVSVCVCVNVREMGPATKDSLFDVPQGAPHFGLSKMT